MKLQVALEYMIVFAFVIVMFMTIFITISNQRASVSNEELNSHLQLVAEDIASQLNIAEQAGSGYSAAIQIPNSGSLLLYSLNITRGGEVIVASKIGTEKISSATYSIAGSVTSSPGFVSANNAYSYAIPIANGTMTLQNSFGSVCVDYACPNITNQTGSMSVATQVVHAIQFNGQNNYVVSSSAPANFLSGSVTSTDAMTYSFWYDLAAYPPAWTDFMSFPCSNCIAIQTDSSGQLYFWAASSSNPHLSVVTLSSSYDPTNTWINVVYALSANSYSVFINGALASSGSISGFSMSDADTYGNSLYINNGNKYWAGEMANVQMYDSYLSNTLIKSIYEKGIAGSPVSNQSLILWWPLNGNVNDQSGNGNQGTVINGAVYPTVVQLFAKVLNHAGSPASNTLVGWTTNLGSFSGNNAFNTSYTNSTGVATAFLNQNKGNGYADIQTTSFNGNSLTQNGLVGWWPLAEGIGGSTYDQSGHGYNGILYNSSWAAPSFVTGFDGLNSYVLLPSSSPSSQSTVSAWINPGNQSTNGRNGRAEILNFQSAYFNLLSPGDLCYYLAGVNSGYLCTTSQIPRNTWSYVTARYNGSYEALFVNGKLQATQADSGTPVTVGSPGAIGYCWYCGQMFPLSDFNGSIANVQYYNGPLSQNEITSLYDQGLTAPPLSTQNAILWMPLNGDAIDYSGHGYNGTAVNVNNNVFNLINATNSSTTPITMGAFNGVSKIFIGNTLSLQPEGSFTVSAWVNVTTSQSGNPMIVSDSAPTGQVGYNLSLSSNKPKFTVRQFGYAWGTCSFTGSASVVNAGTHQITGVYNGSYVSLYVDGVSQGSSSCNANAITTFVNYSTSSNAVIGNGFNGLIGNVQVYSTALSASNITRLASKGVATFPLPRSGLVGWFPIEGNGNDYSIYQDNGTTTNLNYLTQNSFLPALSYSLTGGYGLQFNGENSYVKLPQITREAGTNSITFAVWFRVSSLTTTWPMIFGDTSASTRNGYDLFVSGANPPTGTAPVGDIVIERFAAGSGVGAYDKTPIALNTWYYAVATYNGTNEVLYVNGVPVTSLLSTNSITVNAQMSLGALGGIYDFGNDQIANFQVYSTALNSSQVFQLYRNQVPPSDTNFVPLSVIP